jgi:voltage-gated potassium channel
MGRVIVLLLRVLRVGHRRHVVWLLSAAVACALAGGGAFAAVYPGGLPFSTGLYWAITPATTVGYGDVTPKNAAGRVIASLVMLTTIPLLASVFALLTGGVVAAGVRRILAVRSHFPDSAYRLVVGSGPMVHAIAAELVEAGIPVVLAADIDPETMPDGVHVVRGDPTEPAAIAAAKPERAEQALVVGNNDGDVLVSTVLLRKRAPQLPISALVRSASAREALRELGVQQTVSAEELLARTLAMSLEAPHAGDVVSQLVESATHRLTEVQPEASAVGRPLSAVRSEREGLVLGLVHGGVLSLGIGDDPVVASGDLLLVAVPGSRRARAARSASP